MCGNAFKLDSTQAVLADQQPRAAAADSRTYVAQCRHAVALRRLWTIPPVAIGTAILCLYAGAGVLGAARAGLNGATTPRTRLDHQRLHQPTTVHPSRTPPNTPCQSAVPIISTETIVDRAALPNNTTAHGILNLSF